MEETKTIRVIMKTLLIIIPFIIGVALSSKILPQASPAASPSSAPNGIGEGALNAVDASSSLGKLTFAIHRNGEAEPCGTTIYGFHERLVSLLSDSVNKSTKSGSGDDVLRNLDLSKHQVDATLTETFGKYLLSASSCGPETAPPSIKGNKRKTWGRGENYHIEGVDSSFLTFCDMGDGRVPILHDHNDLVFVKIRDQLELFPCHFHTREGLRITSLDQLIDLSKATMDKTAKDCSVSDEGEQTCEMNNMMHLYAVPAGRLFMFAPAYVGETFTLSHVSHPGNPEPVTLKVLSVSPRVLDVINFFEEEESKAIVDKALKETSETHKIKRSSTGASGYNVNSQRTSENGFDTHGKTSVAVKKRTLEMAGFDEYVEAYTDGLQVLRYNKTTAYIPHMDWIDDPGQTNSHNFDSSRQGTNRFATVLLYMTNLKDTDGGETVFKHGWPVGIPVSERRKRKDVLGELRRSGETSFLKQGSWEETMVADCRSRLSVKPHAGRAVLFYSQHPNGEEDLSSLHGGCPVLSGSKWAANNWIWNGPRGGFPGAPMNPNFKGTEEEANPGQLKGHFENTGKNPQFRNAKLYFQETVWGDFGPGKFHSVNTYHGHEWNIKDSDGTLLKQWKVDASPKLQYFKV